MEKKALILQCYHLLDLHYPKEIVFLEFKNPYQTLISVILSAQTTDRQVASIQEPLFSLYPTPDKLANASAAEVENIIRPVGFFKVKAKNIIGSAQMLVEHFGGEVPQTIDELLRLPGVGRKSANVVMGHCFNQPAIIVDTHFGRVVYRLGLTHSKNPQKVEEEIAFLLPASKHYRFSMAANLHGREICFARKPACEKCFLATLCLRSFE